MTSCGAKLLAALVLGAAVWFGGECRAATSDVYVVAVGSSYYAAATEPGANRFPELTGANKSARAVAERLRRGGATYGILLTSQDGRYVTKADVSSAIDDVASRMRADHPKAPLVVFYIAAHGISDGVAWNHFSVPGDFTYRGDPSHLDVESLAAAAIHAAQLNHDLSVLKVPYLVILDTCYEGHEAEFASPVLTGPAIESLRSIAGVLRFANEFHQSDPVLFSTAPGTVVRTVVDPSDPGGTPIAPLARRASILLDEADAANRMVTLGDFLRAMISAGLDPKTGPAITHATPDGSWKHVLAAHGLGQGPIVERLGSGRSTHVCCAPVVSTTEVAARAVSGRLDLSGSPGDYVTQGRKVSIASSIRPLTLTEHGPGDVTVEVDPDGAGWKVEMSTPNARPFTRMSYGRATRYGFNSPNRPGLAVSGDGRGCNEVKGQFLVEDVTYDASGRIDRLIVRLTQSCEDGHGMLDGHLELRAGLVAHSE